jgi:hypothetical protein
LIVVFVGLLWLIGLACGERRRAYVIVISGQAMGKVHDLLRSPPEAYGRMSAAAPGLAPEEIGQAVLKVELAAAPQPDSPAENRADGDLA